MVIVFHYQPNFRYVDVINNKMPIPATRQSYGLSNKGRPPNFLTIRTPYLTAHSLIVSRPVIYYSKNQTLLPTVNGAKCNTHDHHRITQNYCFSLFTGCYKDSHSRRAMSNYYGMVPNSIASVDTCISTCRARGRLSSTHQIIPIIMGNLCLYHSIIE